MFSFNDRAQNWAATEKEKEKEGNCICAVKHTEKLLVCVCVCGGGGVAEEGRSIWIAAEQDIEGYMVYDHIRKHSHVWTPLYSISHTHKHAHTWTPGRRGAVWFVCVVGAVDGSDGGSNCLMVGFMETLYNACDSLFSACQEGGICDTTMAGTLPQPPVHLCTQRSQLRREKWAREMWICLHVKRPQSRAPRNADTRL